MTATATARSRQHRPTSRPEPASPERPWVFHAVMAPVTLLWVLPLVFVILVAVRSFDDIASNGLGTWPASFTLDGFRHCLGRRRDRRSAAQQPDRHRLLR